MRARLANLLTLPLVVGAVLTDMAAVAIQGGRTSVGLDILAQFAPVLLGAGLAIIGGALLSHRPWRSPLLVLGLVAVVSSGSLILPEFTRPQAPAAQAGAPREVKIIQFNVLYSNEHIDLIATWLMSQHPDIVVIEEGGRELREAIVARAGWQISGGGGDLMIFSGRPRLGDDSNSRGALLPWVTATFPSASGPYDVVGVHLGWPIGPIQRSQWMELAALIGRLPQDRTILAGDFNATPWGFTMRRGERELGLIRRDRALASFPAIWKADGPVRSPIAILPIDHVYAGPGWATVKVERGPELGSDHYPVIVTLAPVTPAPSAPR